MENCQTILAMPLLSSLMFNGNNYSGKVPESITNIYGLMLLDLSNKKFSSNTLPDFSSNVNLQIIDFSSNEFSSEIPTSFSHLIRILSLGKNRFFGRLSRNLTNMSTLEHLDIHDNKIIGELLDICQISTLKILNLRNNSLQGSIPYCISNLTSLQILDLSSNHLVGEIPVKFGNLAGMISIETPSGFSYFSAILIPTLAIQTKINDVIVNWKKSKQVLSWNNLKIYSLLDLSMNQISGKIPSSLGSLKALKLLNISHNIFSGMISTSLGDLENLESLDLSYNNLSGSIPQSLSKLQQLTILDVSNNKLTGKIPVGSQMDTMNNPKFYANNSGLCGMQNQVPCLEDLPPTKPLEVKSKETWFSWEGVGIGYAIGFFVAVGILYIFGYFVPTKPPNFRRQQRRQRI